MQKIELFKATQDIIDITEKVSGKEIELIYNPKMTAYCAVKQARKNMPKHLIYYNEKSMGMMNALVSHECGHIKRIFSLDESDRKIRAANGNNIAIAYSQCEKDLRTMRRFVSGDINRHWNYIFSRMVTWLTNMPIDVRIEKWIYEFGNDELRNAQERWLDKQITNDVKIGFGANFKRAEPKIIYDATIILNYSYALCIDSILGKDYSDKYEKVFDKYGEKAIELVGIIFNDEMNDKDVTDRCTEILGLRDWYIWTDFENVPSDYGSTLPY